MNVRGILPTWRPDDIPLAEWKGTLAGQSEAMDRAMSRVFILLVVRPGRRLWRVAAKLREPR
jgi:hypothetical protein